MTRTKTSHFITEAIGTLVHFRFKVAFANVCCIIALDQRLLEAMMTLIHFENTGFVLWMEKDWILEKRRQISMFIDRMLYDADLSGPFHMIPFRRKQHVTLDSQQYPQCGY